jgi:serine/threonine-protein kinase HipA
MSAIALPDILFLWWLGQPTAPRLVGTLRWVRRAQQQQAGVSLRYSAEWLATGFALSEDLPLRDAEFMPAEADAAAGAVDDARPDRWGERVIRLLIKPQRLSTLDYLYFAGDDRFGGLGVSTSDAVYAPHQHGTLPQFADVQQVHDLVRRVEAGEMLAEPLRHWVAPGATLGGAKPKALLAMDGAQWVLKFAEAGEVCDSGLVEHACMTLALQAGIDVCETRPIAYQQGSNIRHAVAVRRFDRLADQRLHAVSANVALRAEGVDYGYPELALLLRRRGEAAHIRGNGEQVFRRMVFNIVMDNTDDHEKNHALLRVNNVNNSYSLAPAFDVLPAAQALGYQSMRVGQLGAVSTLDNAMSEHQSFGMTLVRAKEVMADVVTVAHAWQAHFAQMGVSAPDVAVLAQAIDRPFLLNQRLTWLRT